MQSVRQKDKVHLRRVFIPGTKIPVDARPVDARGAALLELLDRQINLKLYKNL
jgi:hypothetical protein